MTRVLAIVLAAGIGAWVIRNRVEVGEWLRQASDIPTNAVLLGTSGFEREGRDPAKRP